MPNFIKTFIPLLFLVVLNPGCNNQDDSSPYEELLSRPPYSKLTDSIHQNSSDPDLYYRRGMLLFKNNNNPPALADFRKAWSLNKKETYAINISNILSEEKPDSAISFLQEALNTLPASIPLRINLIQAYADKQKTDEALTICDSVLQQHPGQVGILMMKSDLLDQKNDSIGSLKTLEQAYLFAPGNEDLCYNLAFKYAQSKNSKALTLCDSLLHNDTILKKGEPYYFKGVYYSNVNEKIKALDYFNKAIQNDYNFLDAYMDKGRILFEQKKYNDASGVFQLTLKISSTYADAYFWLGKCQEALGQKEDARLNYQRAYGFDKSLTEAKDAAERL
ncbi:MAG: tetratricopeptide repeat protein [Chitinophagales bacterium]